MMGNRALLMNFVEKFIGTIRFENNDFAMIVGYVDIVIGSMMIKRVYYVEGLGHNLFSVGQFCDKGLEVAFRNSACFVRSENGVDLLTGDRSSNLYTIALNEITSNSSSCLLANASSSCYLLNDYDDIGKLKAKGDIGVFVVYSKDSAAFRVYNKRTRKIHESVKIFKNKKDESSLVIQNKERLVAVRYSQQECIDYDGTFAPVARIEAIRLFLAYAAHKDFTVYQIDVKRAFLNGILKEELYLAQPLGFVSKQYPDHEYVVDKALYCLKQAPRAWYDILSKFLIDSGFQRGLIDTTLFIKKKGEHIMLIQIYDDDIIFGSTNPKYCKKVFIFNGKMF
nr:copia protein [Tanacetum cinerariifolium]